MNSNISTPEMGETEYDYYEESSDDRLRRTYEANEMGSGPGILNY